MYHLTACHSPQHSPLVIALCDSACASYHKWFALCFECSEILCLGSDLFLLCAIRYGSALVSVLWCSRKYAVLFCGFGSASKCHIIIIVLCYLMYMCFVINTLLISVLVLVE